MATQEGRLWVDGDLILRVRDSAATSGKVIVIDRPYAVVGRAEGADVRINDRDISSRHVYMHLDKRGLFAVDLATRTGMRINGAAGAAGWLRPGQSLEVAGRRIEVVALRGADEAAQETAGDHPNPLSEAGAAGLPRVGLSPIQAPESPWTVNSELLFLGRSPCCGVRVEGSSIDRIHCVLVRAPSGAYLADLSGRGLELNGAFFQGAVALSDGDILGIGPARFEVRIEAPAADLPAFSPPTTGELALVVPRAASELLPLPPLPAGLVPAESQAAVLGWMMGVLQATQVEMLRRQEDFQGQVVQAMREMRQDQHTLLKQHLKKVERIHRELTTLREEVRRRFGSEAPQPAVPSLPKPPPLRVTPVPAPADPQVATAWLLTRVNQLDAENRSSWKDLLGRLAGSSRESP